MAETGTGCALETEVTARIGASLLVALLRHQPCYGEDPLKIALYAAFVAMVIGAITVILTMPELFNEPSAPQVGLVIWAGAVFLAGFIVARLLKSAATKES
ncbi:hypothetical protein NMP99_16615 [Glutamicibacter mishrai]|uniref:hypothetical protein n=1 Tax=Glutamicibacter mishrai TaxID=1775880 RepID=UPI0020CE3C3B|nr:hypothetical protein [Glutamicibacter mishrai]UTT39599.1 hypothetical protein NMP99_16615 [Glutamicibacter mishrai]